jgi:hypothetical protein
MKQVTAALILISVLFISQGQLYSQEDQELIAGNISIQLQRPLCLSQGSNSSNQVSIQEFSIQA